MSGQPLFDNDSQAPPDDTNLGYTFNNKVMAAAIIVLVLVIFFILMLHFYAKWFWQHSSTSVFIRRGITSTGRAGVVQPSGLDAATIALLPTFTYKLPASASSAAQEAQEDLEAGCKDMAARPLLECAVCLSEFQENEEGRMLPSCKHMFHTECIDMWFFSHSTCPLCRAEVQPAANNIEQHQAEERQEEAMAPSHMTGIERNPNAGSRVVQIPCNVLYWGNETSSSTVPISSSSASAPARGTRALPQIAIDIPSRGSLVLTISTPGRRPLFKSASCRVVEDGEAACSSSQQQQQQEQRQQPAAGLRASLKRMLSRQSSRHGEGNEGSP